MVVKDCFFLKFQWPLVRVQDWIAIGPLVWSSMFHVHPIQSTPGSLAWIKRGPNFTHFPPPSSPHFLLKNGPSYYIACSSTNRWNVNRARRILKSLLMVYGEKTCSYLWELKIQYSILYDWINLYLQSLLQIYKTYSLRICWKQIENVHITHLWKGIFNYTWHRLPLNRWPWIPWIFGIP